MHLHWVWWISSHKKSLALIWHYLVVTLTKANMLWLPFGLLINNCVYLLLASLIIKKCPHRWELMQSRVIYIKQVSIKMKSRNLGIDLLNWTLECVISEYYSKEYIGGSEGVKPVSLEIKWMCPTKEMKERRGRIGRGLAFISYQKKFSV